MSKFRIDEKNMFEELGPELIVALSTAFYDRVYSDPDPWFTKMFPTDKHHAVHNQYEFFIQRLGGPQLYTQRKGHPALRGRHASFDISQRAVGRWLKHMKDAMAEVGIDGDLGERLWEFFYDTAYFLQNVGKDGKRLY